jgi:hypothetical protein
MYESSPPGGAVMLALFWDTVDGELTLLLETLSVTGAATVVQDEAELAAARRRTARSIKRNTVAAVLFVLTTVLWLTALTKPGNVAGVLELEALTVVALGVVLFRLRRLRSRLTRLETRAGPSIEGRASMHATELSDGGHYDLVSAGGPSTSTVLPAPEVQFHKGVHPDLVLRPRVGLILLTLAVGIGMPVTIFKLSYDQGFFDPRVVLVVLYGLLYSVLVIRARIVVSDGTLWRRAVKRYRPLSLDRLASVEFSRNRYNKNEGLLPTGVLRLADCYGRRMRLKPSLWIGGAKHLVAVVDACARSQGIALDERTDQRLSRSSGRIAHQVPAWAYGCTSPRGGVQPDPTVTTRPAASTFWTRRNADGKPKRFQAQRLIPMIAATALMLPGYVALARVGTHAVRSARCSSARRLWTNAPDFPSDGVPPSQVAATLAATPLFGRSGVVYRLRPADLANSHNTPAVRHDATRLFYALDVQWVGGRTVAADVQVQEFPTHADALAFQGDYGEDHCHEGDRAFATPSVAGGVGLRCTCTSTTVNDRVAFVRGRTRVQAIVWAIPANQGHERALQLASIGLAAESGRSITSMQ